MSSSSKNIPQFDLESLIAKNNNALESIMAYDGPLRPLLEDEPIKGVLWEHFAPLNELKALTNFSNELILNLYQLMIPCIVQAGRRGPKPKSSHMDALLCYLIWAKNATHLDKLAKLLVMKTNRLENNIRRIRPILNACLKSKWWDPRQ